jgi:hypothetical protein
VYLAGFDLQRAEAMAESVELRDRMKSGGVTGAPEFTFMTPVHEAPDVQFVTGGWAKRHD